MKKLIIGMITFCLSASLFAQFGAGIRASLNFQKLLGNNDYVDIIRAINPGENPKDFRPSIASFGAEAFIQYDLEHVGFEVDFGLNNRQGMITDYEHKVERTKTIYTWTEYRDYTTYELSPMIRGILRGSEANIVFALGPNFVFTKDTTRFGENDNTIKTPIALQNTFNYGLRVGASIEAPMTEHSLITAGLISTFDFKNAYKDEFNDLAFGNTLSKRMNFHLFMGVAAKF